jgi:glycerate kinase
MKIVIAPDSFKGSASSQEIAQWIESGIHAVIPDCETVKISIGDGGEGSLAAVLSAGFTSHRCEVLGPHGNPVKAEFGIKDQTAFIEMAQASGLSQLRDGEKIPLHATSFGTGQLIRAALDQGVQHIILAVGGSATTDAGAGALQALGAQLLDASGDEIPWGGAALNDCVAINTTSLDPRLATVSFTLACDVTNPLLGPLGAARTFAPQKGATADEVELLEKSLAQFASLVGGDSATRSGAGAAGGFGFMAYTFLRAEMKSGIDLILDLVDFDSHLRGTDYVITGEGRFDSQSMHGKAPWGILKRAEKFSIPTILLCGDADNERSSHYKEVFTLTSLEPNVDYCIQNPAPLVTQLGAQIGSLLDQSHR